MPNSMSFRPASSHSNCIQSNTSIVPPKDFDIANLNLLMRGSQNVRPHSLIENAHQQDASLGAAMAANGGGEAFRLLCENIAASAIEHLRLMRHEWNASSQFFTPKEFDKSAFSEKPAKWSSSNPRMNKFSQLVTKSELESVTLVKDIGTNKAKTIAVFDTFLGKATREMQRLEQLKLSGPEKSLVLWKKGKKISSSAAKDRSAGWQK